MDTATVSFTVSNARPVNSRTVFAVVDVAVECAGISFTICGVQARREPDGRTSSRLPTYKDDSGRWLPAVILPEETRRPLGDAVLQYLVEEGLAKRVF